MCKQIQYDYYCEELFLVKHKSIPSCEGALFFEKPREQIVEECDFTYTFNKTVMPSVLDGGNRIVLANMINPKLVYTDAANLAEPLPSRTYVKVSRTLLCNCQVDASLSYLLKSIGSYPPKNGKHYEVFRYVINMAFLTMFRELWEDIV